MIKHTLLIFAAGVLSFSSCKPSIKPKALYGEWKYIKVDKPKSDDLTDTVSTDDLQTNKPFIRFTSKNELTIYWGSKILSHGTYSLSGDNINYIEQLPGGQTRTFPFYVSQLDGKTIVFETLDKNGSRVTALKRQR